MSWLHALLSSLTFEEISSIKQMRLIGKEEAIFSHNLSALGKSAPSLEECCAEAHITPSHYYKINSILIDKIFYQLCPEGNFELLQWLRTKELYALLKNEVNAQLKLQHDSNYYLNTFRLLIDLPYKYFDEKLTQKLGATYLGSLDNSSDSDRMYVKFHLLFADCNRFAAVKNPEKKFAFVESDFLKWEEELIREGHYLAQYYLYRTLCNYYNYYIGNNEKSLLYLKKAIALKNEISHFFPIDIGQFLGLLYAGALLGFNEVKSSYDLYKELFQAGIDEAMYGFYYHCEQYIIAAILLKKFDEAERLLQQYFDSCISRRNDIYATRGALTYAKLFLSKGELKPALQYISLVSEINEKTFYLPFEIQLRVLENCYFFLREDYDFAKQLCLRNAKFISNQKAGELTKNYRSIFKVLSAMLNSVEQKRAFPPVLNADFITIEKNFRKVYCDLFRLMRDKCEVQKG